MGSVRGGWPPLQEPGGRFQGRLGDGVRFKSHRPLQKRRETLSVKRKPFSLFLPTG
ncbi:hypothetical protein COMA2_60129 [Candidatus Nitrospira nitrificans]|uniref:Uncharacterized protein n=1 Tax=Candidatus Nitrospira nitrificans TaxID=1742973 RepID=A0A0S4LQ28_9BACT|nr:hypothetical protein COMA2_60129 [Candidatus Nitrospira nitrificans]